SVVGMVDFNPNLVRFKPETGADFRNRHVYFNPNLVRFKHAPKSGFFPNKVWNSDGLIIDNLGSVITFSL
ncbi:MAG: hypothetical protein WAU64_07530, partial [Methanoregula sp.]|uniref:hypothetical protein n=1 Tax=Methanoregula sp. TaxID=2052170 RepID=UPI003BAF5FB0